MTGMKNEKVDWSQGLNIFSYPVGSTVALSSHGRQLRIQEVSCFVNTLQTKTHNGSLGLQLHINKTMTM